jgi:hypothetical protein
MQIKNTTFAERQAASVAAKKALLEKFKPKPTVTAEAPINHEAERRVRAEAIRAERQAEKEARQRAREEAAAAAEQARIEAEAAAEQARIEAEHMSDAQKRAERKARKKDVKEAAKLKKEINKLGRSTEEQRAERRRAQETYEWDRERKRA